jgi:hypothetical protein
MAARFGFNNDNIREVNFKKADAFINFSIATNTESGRVKLGNGVRLFADRNAEKELIGLYKRAQQKSKEQEFNEWLKEQLIVDFRLATSDGGAPLTATPDFLV